MSKTNNMICKNVDRKAQGVPLSQAEANPRHKVEV